VEINLAYLPEPTRSRFAKRTLEETAIEKVIDGFMKQGMPLREDLVILHPPGVGFDEFFQRVERRIT
jgi:hypothetical protein